MRNNNRTNLQDKSSRRAVDSKVIKNSNRKPEASSNNKISSNISSKTIPRDNSNKSKGSRINSASNGNNKTILQDNSNKSKDNRINNASNGNSKTIPQNNRNESKGNRINNTSNRSNKPEGNTINSDSNPNNTTTDLRNNAVPLKYINNRSLGRGIVLTTGSLITEHGNNGAAIVATAFLMPVSGPPMARHTGSAFIVFQ
jgi:hypothetical protein